MSQYDASKIKTGRLSKEILLLEKGRLLHVKFMNLTLTFLDTLNEGKIKARIDFKMNNENGVQFMEVMLPGPKESIYEGETFHLVINFDDFYPCLAPKLKFITPIYHPNIDKDFKICLNTLNMPPDGSYNPTLSIESIILSVQLLISNPNPYDPLRSDAATDFIMSKDIYEKKAKEQMEQNRKVGTNATLKRKLFDI